MGDIDRGRYHFKEIDKSLLLTLERKIEQFGGDEKIVKNFRERLRKLEKRLF